MAKAPSAPVSARNPFIPIQDDDDDAPTVARNLGPATTASVGPLQLPRRPTTAPYSTLSTSASSAPGKKPTTIPPPPPAAAFAAPSPPVPVFAPGGSSFTAPPPPPMPPSRAFASDAPFDPDMPTPPPPPTDEFAPPTPMPMPIYQISSAGLPLGAPPLRSTNPGLPPPSSDWPAPSLPSPGNSWSAPLDLQQPETIDFAADAAPLTIRRSGPPGLVVLVFLLGAMAGGAKLAQVVTRGDVAALDASQAAPSSPITVPLGSAPAPSAPTTAPPSK
jgi:hypothetical protein